MLRPHDITGILALPATPTRIDADPWGPATTVDLDEASRVAGRLVDDGVGSIGLCGTTGECAALTWAEKRELYGTVVETVRGRVPVFAGATTLGTRDAVAQMRELRDLGVDAAFVGLPMWQTPTLANAVGFYADLARAVPDLPVVVYGNRFFFKFTYPADFWRGIATQAPTVIACKVGFPFDDDTLSAAGGRVQFLHGETMLVDAWRTRPSTITAGWATSAAMGPEPWVAFFEALQRGDHDRCSQVIDDIATVPSPVPDFSLFASYNTQTEKARIDAAGYMRCGPPRPPYVDLPDAWQRAAVANAEAWARLRERYAPTSRTASTS